MKIGKYNIKEVNVFSWYNFFYYVPKSISTYDFVRFGQNIYIQVKVFGFSFGIYRHDAINERLNDMWRDSVSETLGE